MAKFKDRKFPKVTGLSRGVGGKTDRSGAGITFHQNDKDPLTSGKTIMHTKIEGSIRRGVQFGRSSKSIDPDIIEIKPPGRGNGKYTLKRDPRNGQYELVVSAGTNRSFGGTDKPGSGTTSSMIPEDKKPPFAPDIEGSIYLSSDDAVSAIQIIIAMNGLLNQMGYLPLVPLTVERGSWFTTFKSKAKAGLQSDEAKILAEQARITAEAYAEKQKVENLEKMAQATAHLMGSVPEGDTAAFDLPGLRIISHEIDGKRHWVVQAETARSQAVRSVDEAKAMSQQVFEEYYPQSEQIERDKPVSAIEE